MNKRLFLLSIFIAVAVLWQWSTALVSAQVSIKMSPVKQEELVDPGQVFQSQIKVTNESGGAKTFYVYLRDFKAEGETGQAKLVPPGTEKGYSLAAWIEITGEGLEFGPGEEKIIPYKINIPPDASPGGYFGAILMGTAPPKLQLDSEEKGAGMAIAQQTASLVLLRVKGDVFEEAKIREFNTDKDFYPIPFKVDFMVRIENTGNVHIQPFGMISITNMFGREVAVIRVNENRGNILPFSTRKFDGLSWEGDNSFGRYTASMGLTYGAPVKDGGQGQSSLYAAKSFWIIPWRIIIPIMLTLILISALMFLLLRLYRNKAIRKAMTQAGLGQMRYVSKFQGPSPTLHLFLILLVVFIALFLLMGAVYLIFFA